MPKRRHKLWLVRNRDGSACLFVGPKPTKNEKTGWWQTKGMWGVMTLSPDESQYPQAKWEDGEPIEVKLVIKYPRT